MEDSNWVKARSSLVWIAAILVSFGAVWWIERESGKELIDRQSPAPAATGAPAGRAVALPASPDLPAERPPRPLTPQERQWAQLAWAYFERNTDAATGLVPSVEGFPAATLWDMASSLLALLAARDLGLIEQPAFDQRLGRALASLAKLPLYGGQLPNKSYDVRDLRMTDYANKPTEAGIGWSAIDIGRLLVPLNAIAWQHPRHTEAARQVIARWDTRPLARDGQLWGMQVADGSAPQAVQEGRLGYEQYAARTFALMGLDVDVAADPMAHLRLVGVEGVQVPADDRDPRQFGAPNFVVSEPWMLGALEFGWGRREREMAWRVYRAQEERFRRTGVRTAATEDHVDQAPYFVNNSVWTAGKPWAAVTEKGAEVPQLRTLSTKAAFAWHALYATPYTAQLVEAVSKLQEPGRGWYAGLYEADGRPNKALTANTNAVVLESLAYTVRGSILRSR